MAGRSRRKVSLRTKFAVLLICIMAVGIVVSGVWSNVSQNNQAQREMLEKAQILAQEMDAVWTFFKTNQNQFKTDENGNYELYCVVAAKAVSKFFTTATDYNIHYTNITTRRPSDAPDAFETEALNTFLADESASEYYELTETQEGKKVFRYVQPLYMTETCLECHGDPKGELDSFGYEKEGKQIGDVAGAISITMPVDLYMDNIRGSILEDCGVFGVVLLIVVLVVSVGLSRLVTKPLGSLEVVAERIEEGDFAVRAEGIGDNDEISDLATRFNSMASQLATSYDTLETQVQNRTQELALANDELEKQRAQLEQAYDELQEVSRFKSDFLATMSHELRTPLTSIIAFTEIWENSTANRDEGEQEAVSEIREKSQVLLHMVDNILEVGRSEAGKLQLLIEPVEMVDLVNEVEAELAPLAQKRSVDFSTSVDFDVPIIMSDWDKIRRIIVNLSSNAIKYNKEQGSVRLEVHNDADRAGILVVVSDTGIGIKEEHLPYLFDKYMQVEETTQKRREGSGLGLAVVKDLVDLFGGEVNVESIYGQGTVFRVFVPAEVTGWGEEHEDSVG